MCGLVGLGLDVRIADMHDLDTGIKQQLLAVVSTGAWPSYKCTNVTIGSNATQNS